MEHERANPVKWSIYGTVFLFALMIPAIAYAENRVFRCRVENIIGWPDPPITRLEKFYLEKDDALIFDSKTGILRLSRVDLAPDFVNMVIIYADGSDDLVGLRMHDNTGRTTVEVLKIQTGKPRMPFIFWDEGKTTLTGHCSAEF